MERVKGVRDHTNFGMPICCTCGEFVVSRVRGSTQSTRSECLRVLRCLTHFVQCPSNCRDCLEAQCDYGGWREYTSNTSFRLTLPRAMSSASWQQMWKNTRGVICTLWTHVIGLLSFCFLGCVSLQRCTVPFIGFSRFCIGCYAPRLHV